MKNIKELFDNIAANVQDRRIMRFIEKAGKADDEEFKKLQEKAKKHNIELGRF